MDLKSRFSEMYMLAQLRFTIIPTGKNIRFNEDIILTQKNNSYIFSFNLHTRKDEQHKIILIENN